MLAHQFVSDVFNERSLFRDHKWQLCIQDKLRKSQGALEIVLLSWERLAMFENTVKAHSQWPHQTTKFIFFPMPEEQTEMGAKVVLMSVEASLTNFCDCQQNLRLDFQSSEMDLFPRHIITSPWISPVKSQQ